ncbi:hypothetical protein [Planctomyces sp. SH-PL14]|uniref:hypothetical protein n=1 Tax=Planctomyces sp. SH-PL14 TaxID=1632864 RepID=UPI00078E8527|nr:hypothetical protein [Planctomyces sp. SH-PL14]AMV18901.1 hypothetical protein VT03_13510 [Planctomyces sp. SH-PL14]
MKTKRVLVVAGTTAIALLAMHSSLWAAAVSPQPTGGDEKDWIDITQIIIQCAFWICLSVVTVKTYRSASRTLLQPLRTEVFKEQLAAAKQLVSMFIGKDEIELRELFAYNEFIVANAVSLADSYANCFFNTKVDEGKRPYSSAKCASGLVLPSAGWELIDTPRKSSPDDVRKKVESRRKFLKENWQEYKQEQIHLPNAYAKTVGRLQKMTENPLLPTECIRLTKEILDAVHDNKTKMFKILEAEARRLPELFPSADDLGSFTPYSVANKFAAEYKDIKPKADALVAFFRSHYKTDSLWEV